MDLSAQPTYNVLIERQGYAFFLNIEYENVPKFCSHCNSIGHSLDARKKLNSYIVNRHTRKQPEKTFFKAKDGKINMDKGKEPLNEYVSDKALGNIEIEGTKQPESS